MLCTHSFCQIIQTECLSPNRICYYPQISSKFNSCTIQLDLFKTLNGSTLPCMYSTFEVILRILKSSLKIKILHEADKKKRINSIGAGELDYIDTCRVNHSHYPNNLLLLHFYVPLQCRMESTKSKLRDSSLFY